MSLPDAIAQAEATLQAVTAALVSADADRLETTSTQLRDAFMALAVQRQQQLRTGQPLDAALQQRIDAIGLQLSPLREQLARVSALSNLQLATLLPAQAGAPTYESLAGRPATGGPARIYRNVG